MSRESEMSRGLSAEGDGDGDRTTDGIRVCREGVLAGVAVLIGEGFIGTGAARVMSLRIRLTTSPSCTGYSSRSLLSARAFPFSRRRTAAGFAGDSCDLMERTVSDGDTLRVVEDAGLSDLKVRVIADDDDPASSCFRWGSAGSGTYIGSTGTLFSEFSGGWW